MIEKYLYEILEVRKEKMSKYVIYHKSSPLKEHKSLPYTLCLVKQVS